LLQNYRAATGSKLGRGFATKKKKRNGLVWLVFSSFSSFLSHVIVPYCLFFCPSVLLYYIYIYIYISSSHLLATVSGPPWTFSWQDPPFSSKNCLTCAYVTSMDIGMESIRSFKGAVSTCQPSKFVSRIRCQAPLLLSRSSSV
jgi:hypothetical protein